MNKVGTVNPVNDFLTIIRRKDIDKSEEGV